MFWSDTLTNEPNWLPHSIADTVHPLTYGENISKSILSATFQNIIVLLTTIAICTLDPLNIIL